MAITILRFVRIRLRAVRLLCITAGLRWIGFIRWCLRTGQHASTAATTGSCLRRARRSIRCDKLTRTGDNMLSTLSIGCFHRCAGRHTVSIHSWCLDDIRCRSWHPAPEKRHSLVLDTERNLEDNRLFIRRLCKVQKKYHRHVYHSVGNNQNHNCKSLDKTTKKSDKNK